MCWSMFHFSLVFVKVFALLVSTCSNIICGKEDPFPLNDFDSFS